jgi:hypothetical protein
MGGSKSPRVQQRHKDGMKGTPYGQAAHGGRKSTIVQLNGYEASWLGQGDGSKEYDLRFSLSV